MQSAREAAGAAGTRRSPRPLMGGRFSKASGASRREIVKSYRMNTNASHSQPSSPAKAGDTVFRGAGDRTERPQRTGYPAFAGYDGHREERITPDRVRQQRKTPAARGDRGFSKANAKFRSVSADVDRAPAKAKRGGHAACHVASVVTIAATDVAMNPGDDHDRVHQPHFGWPNCG